MRKLIENKDYVGIKQALLRDPNLANKGISLGNAIGQIMLIDAVFSFDSIITAGGTAKHVEIMILYRGKDYVYLFVSHDC